MKASYFPLVFWVGFLPAGYYCYHEPHSESGLQEVGHTLGHPSYSGFYLTHQNPNRYPGNLHNNY